MLVPTQGRVSAQTDRKRCEFAKGSVKFRNVTEEQEKRRTRKENWLKRKINSFNAFERQEQQPGRILETVNSDNNKSLTRRSHRRVFLFWASDFACGSSSPPLSHRATRCPSFDAPPRWIETAGARPSSRTGASCADARGA